MDRDAVSRRMERVQLLETIWGALSDEEIAALSTKFWEAAEGEEQGLVVAALTAFLVSWLYKEEQHLRILIVETIAEAFEAGVREMEHRDDHAA